MSLSFDIDDKLSQMDAAMRRAEEIIRSVHLLRRKNAAKSEIAEKLEFLKNDLIRNWKSVRAIVRNLKQVSRNQRTEVKKMRETYNNLKAYETEARTLSNIQDDIEMISNKDFAELRRLMNPSVTLKHLFTGIAILFQVPKCDRWRKVQSFIASASTKDKILGLRPEHIEKKTILRLKKYLNWHHDTLNRSAAYQANRKIAPLEPWLRAMIALAEKIVIDGIVPETRHEKLVKIQAEMQIKLTGVEKLTHSVDNAIAQELDVIKAFETIYWNKGMDIRKFNNLGNLLGELCISEEDAGPSFEEVMNWYNSVTRLSLSSEVMKFTIRDNADQSIPSNYNRKHKTEYPEITGISISKSNGDKNPSNFKKEEGLKKAVQLKNVDLSELLSDGKKHNSTAALGDFNQTKRNYNIKRVPPETKKEKRDDIYDSLFSDRHGSGSKWESQVFDLTISPIFESHFRPTSVVIERSMNPHDENILDDELNDTFVVVERNSNLLHEKKLDEELNNLFEEGVSKSSSQKINIKIPFIEMQDINDSGLVRNSEQVTKKPSEMGERYSLTLNHVEIDDSLDEDDPSDLGRNSDLDPKVLQSLTLKMQESWKRISRNFSARENKELQNAMLSEDHCKDIIVRWNTWKRHSSIGLSLDTDIFDVWEDMGYDFKKYQKVKRAKTDYKPIGYHVEEQTPWLKKVQTMRETRYNKFKEMGNIFEKKEVGASVSPRFLEDFAKAMKKQLM